MLRLTDCSDISDALHTVAFKYLARLAKLPAVILLSLQPTGYKVVEYDT